MSSWKRDNTTNRINMQLWKKVEGWKKVNKDEKDEKEKVWRDEAKVKRCEGIEKSCRH